MTFPWAGRRTRRITTTDEQERARVGEHVGGVGEKRERAGEDAGDDLDDHEADDQREPDRQPPRVGVLSDRVRVTCMAVAVARPQSEGTRRGGFSGRLGLLFRLARRWLEARVRADLAAARAEEPAAERERPRRSAGRARRGRTHSRPSRSRPHPRPRGDRGRDVVRVIVIRVIVVMVVVRMIVIFCHGARVTTLRCAAVILDGHNDLALRVWQGRKEFQVDLAAAEQVGFAGGFFALGALGPAIDPPAPPYALPLDVADSDRAGACRCRRAASPRSRASTSRSSATRRRSCRAG